MKDSERKIKTHGGVLVNEGGDKRRTKARCQQTNDESIRPRRRDETERGRDRERETHRMRKTWSGEKQTRQKQRMRLVQAKDRKISREREFTSERGSLH